MSNVTYRWSRSAALLCAALLGIPHTAASQVASAYERGSAALTHAINSLGNTGRVLLIGAHPDDEDSPLIAWLSRTRHIETAYLSLTRGESGQNYLGGERSDALGVIRTAEVLAARRLDGARQYFTRAFDFGFSKSAEETLQHWPRDTVMGDVVRVVRAFRPQVIIALHSGTVRDENGHHQLAGLLARDAYDASADTARFRVTAYGEPWTVSKLYRAGSAFGPALVIDVGEFDPLTGRSGYELAAESRALHKSQGLSLLQQKGAIFDTLSLDASRVSEGAPSPLLFDGVDTTWSRLRARSPRADVQQALDSASGLFADLRALGRHGEPTALVQPLARLVRLLRIARDSAGLRPWRLLSAEEEFSQARFVDVRGIDRADIARAAAKGRNISAGPSADTELWNAVDVNIARAEQALLLAAGIAVEVFAPRTTFPIVEPNKSNVPDTMRVNVAVFNRGHEAVHLIEPNSTDTGDSVDVPIPPDSAFRFSRIKGDTHISTQWWRLLPRGDSWYSKSIDARDEREREAPRTVSLSVALDIAGTRVKVMAPIVNRVADPVKGEQQQPAAAVPGIVIGLAHGLEFIRANVPVTRQMHVRILSAYQSPETVTVSLPMMPPGLKPDSAQRVRVLTPEAPAADVVFFLTGHMKPGRYAIGAVAMHQGLRSSDGYYTIRYDHILPQRMYASSSMWLQAVDVSLPPRATVGYVSGLDDDGADVLLELDVPVERIEPLAVAQVDLRRFSTIVIGPRAYASFPALVAANARLLEFVKQGGTLLVQYGQTEMTKPGIMPFPIQFAQPVDRVADERAPITLLAPNARVLNVPNRIGADDWKDWVTERATYLPRAFDQHYQPLVSTNDPEEPPNQSGLLVAHYGKGTYIYAPLAIYRQLSAGIPGPARLFVNLITPATAVPATRPATRK